MPSKRSQKRGEIARIWPTRLYCFSNLKCIKVTIIEKFRRDRGLYCKLNCMLCTYDLKKLQSSTLQSPWISCWYLSRYNICRYAENWKFHTKYSYLDMQEFLIFPPLIGEGHMLFTRCMWHLSGKNPLQCTGIFLMSFFILQDPSAVRTWPQHSISYKKNRGCKVLIYHAVINVLKKILQYTVDTTIL